MALSDVLAIDDVRARPYRLPTDRPHADGTYAWHAPTIVVVEVDAKPVTGLGYTYTDASAGRLAAGAANTSAYAGSRSAHRMRAIHRACDAHARARWR